MGKGAEKRANKRPIKILAINSAANIEPAGSDTSTSAPWIAIFQVIISSARGLALPISFRLNSHHLPVP